MHDEKSSADNTSAEEWKYIKVPIYLGTFSPDDIYNADETGLYYRATPNGDIALSDCKKAVDRITVVCCANMSGTDKEN